MPRLSSFRTPPLGWLPIATAAAYFAINSIAGGMIAAVIDDASRVRQTELPLSDLWNLGSGYAAGLWLFWIIAGLRRSAIRWSAGVVLYVALVVWLSCFSVRPWFLLFIDVGGLLAIGTAVRLAVGLPGWHPIEATPAADRTRQFSVASLLWLTAFVALTAMAMRLPSLDGSRRYWIGEIMHWLVMAVASTLMFVASLHRSRVLAAAAVFVAVGIVGLSIRISVGLEPAMATPDIAELPRSEKLAFVSWITAGYTMLYASFFLMLLCLSIITAVQSCGLGTRRPEADPATGD